jgi:hypothetical protein
MTGQPDSLCESFNGAVVRRSKGAGGSNHTDGRTEGRKGKGGGGTQGSLNVRVCMYVYVCARGTRPPALETGSLEDHRSLDFFIH